MKHCSDYFVLICLLDLQHELVNLHGDKSLIQFFFGSCIIYFDCCYCANNSSAFLCFFGVGSPPMLLDLKCLYLVVGSSLNFHIDSKYKFSLLIEVFPRWRYLKGVLVSSLCFN